MAKEMEHAEVYNRQYLGFQVTSKTAKGCQRKLDKALKDYVHAGGYYTKIKTSWHEDFMGNILSEDEFEEFVRDNRDSLNY